MCRDLGAVAASFHAAPSPRVAPARVVEKKDARRVPALPRLRRIAFAKKVGGVFGNWNKQVQRVGQVPAHLPDEAASGAGQLRVGGSPTLIVWGKNDQIFPAAGARPYKRDLKALEYHELDTGHFALEEEGDTIARLMREFLGKHVAEE